MSPIHLLWAYYNFQVCTHKQNFDCLCPKDSFIDALQVHPYKFSRSSRINCNFQRHRFHFHCLISKRGLHRCTRLETSRKNKAEERIIKRKKNELPVISQPYYIGWNVSIKLWQVEKQAEATKWKTGACGRFESRIGGRASLVVYWMNLRQMGQRFVCFRYLFSFIFRNTPLRFYWAEWALRAHPDAPPMHSYSTLWDVLLSSELVFQV